MVKETCLVLFFAMGLIQLIPGALAHSMASNSEVNYPSPIKELFRLLTVEPLQYQNDFRIVLGENGAIYAKGKSQPDGPYSPWGEAQETYGWFSGVLPIGKNLDRALVEIVKTDDHQMLLRLGFFQSKQGDSTNLFSGAADSDQIDLVILLNSAKFLGAINPAQILKLTDERTIEATEFRTRTGTNDSRSISAIRILTQTALYLERPTIVGIEIDFEIPRTKLYLSFTGRKKTGNALVDQTFPYIPETSD